MIISTTKPFSTFPGHREEVCASPLFYSYFGYHNRLQSPYRGQDALGAISYQDYEKLNSDENGYCKLHPRNLALYFNFERPRSPIGAFDDNALFMTPAIPFLFILFLLFSFPFKRFHIVTLCGLALLSFGTFTPLPRMLWWLVPGISLFRQWCRFQCA